MKNKKKDWINLDLFSRSSSPKEREREKVMFELMIISSD
jgi:hypothetical protein